MQLQTEGAPLNNGEISNNLQGLLIGGNLTTTDLIGNAIWLFLTHPEELAKLKADPSLINNAVEEVSLPAMNSPVDITGRLSRRAILDIGGCPVKQRQSLLAVPAWRQPRSGSLSRTAPLRHRAQGRAACRIRRRLASVHRRTARADGGAGRAHRVLRHVPERASRRSGREAGMAVDAILPRAQGTRCGGLTPRHHTSAQSVLYLR